MPLLQPKPSLTWVRSFPSDGTHKGYAAFLEGKYVGEVFCFDAEGDWYLLTEGKRSSFFSEKGAKDGLEWRLKLKGKIR